VTVSADDALVADAPLLAAWLEQTSGEITPFTIPGHKRAAGRLSLALAAVLAGDIPLYGGLDSVKLSGGMLSDAEARAATLWGADWCRFSTGGSTHANQALLMAIGRPGDAVLVSRSAHRSTLLGLVMAGLEPVWLPTELDDRFGLPIGVGEPVLRKALAARPDAKAVVLVEPSYLGTVSDVPALIGLAHSADIPVLVDQAWGAHFGFHPAVPAHAISQGADALVTSAHKTLPAYSQASILLARTQRLNPARLERAFEAGNTTSPAGSILASTDGARSLMAARGTELLESTVNTVTAARQQLRRIRGVLVPGPEDFAPGRFDPAKLVVLLAGTGASGIDVERDLLGAGLPVEMADHDTVVPIVTVADTERSVARLVDALTAAVVRHAGQPRPVTSSVQWGPAAIAAMSPRDAFFADHATVDAAAAVGRVCAEVVAPYPPGVPVLVPGEVVTAEVMRSLHAMHASGTRLAYAADPTLQTLQVVVPTTSRHR
jgi:arginine decarboxylase